jgi:hypothetical protein
MKQYNLEQKKLTIFSGVIFFVGLILVGIESFKLLVGIILLMWADNATRRIDELE